MRQPYLYNWFITICYLSFVSPDSYLSVFLSVYVYVCEHSGQYRSYVVYLKIFWSLLRNKPFFDSYLYMWSTVLMCSLISLVRVLTPNLWHLGHLFISMIFITILYCIALATIANVHINIAPAMLSADPPCSCVAIIIPKAMIGPQKHNISIP